MNNKEFYKKVIILVIPMALQNLINVGVMATDVIMLGKVGEIALSGASLGGQPAFILNLIMFGLASGASVLTAQYWGKGETKPIKLIVTMIVRFSVFMGLIVALISFFFPEQIMSIFTPDQAIIDAGASYIKIICFSYPFFGLVSVFYTSIRSIEAVKIAVISNLTALFINAFLNYVLIFGNFGAPALGIEGAAIATLIARMVEFIIAIIYMFIFDKKLKIRIKDFFKFDKVLSGDLVVISSPVVINELMWALGMSMQAGLLGRLGSTAIAANTMISVVQQLSTVAVFGVAGSAAILIGKSIGEGNMQEARDRGHTFKIISVLFGICVTLLILALQNVAIDFYNASVAAKELAHQMIYVAAGIGFFVSIAATGVVGVLRGGGDTKFSLLIEVVSLWFVAVPAAYFVAFVLHWPPVFVYLVMKIDEPVKGVLFLIRARGSKWIRNVTRDNIIIDD